MKTLRQVWDLNNRQCPFVARYKNWAKDTYVVVLQFGAWVDEKEKDPLLIDLSEHPIGIPFTNGKANTLLIRYPLFAKHNAIPNYDYPDWELVEGISFDRFQKKNIFNLNDYILFGKYTGWLVNDLINTNLKYITWMIVKSAYYTFDRETMQYMADNIPNFNMDLVKIAEEKEIRILTPYEEPVWLEEIKRNEPFVITGVKSKNWDSDEFIKESPFSVSVTPNKEYFINENTSLSKERVKTFTNPFVNDTLKWSTSDDIQLKSLFSQNLSIDEIAKLLYRKPKNVKKRMLFLDLRKEIKKN